MEENTQHKGWFGRNWKWAVPTGGCLLLLLLIVVFAGSIVFGVSALISDSQAHIDAMEKAKNNTILIDRIGEPIETNGMSGGSFESSNGYGTAQLTIPIKGPKGEATIRVEGEGVASTWTYETMNVYVEATNEIINLLEETPFLD